MDSWECKGPKKYGDILKKQNVFLKLSLGSDFFFMHLSGIIAIGYLMSMGSLMCPLKLHNSSKKIHPPYRTGHHLHEGSPVSRFCSQPPLYKELDDFSMVCISSGAHKKIVLNPREDVPASLTRKHMD